jgi:ribosomal protein S18 acetylase RimI-like enzyme
VPIREYTNADWPSVWVIFREVVNAVAESNHVAVRLWQALGFRIIGTVPEAFEHPTLGRVGLYVMHQRL